MNNGINIDSTNLSQFMPTYDMNGQPDWRNLFQWYKFKSYLSKTIRSTQVYDLLQDIGQVNSFPGGAVAQYAFSIVMTDGRIFCIPYNATQARIYNPYNNTVILAGAANSFPGSNSYASGVLLNDGRVFCIPRGPTTGVHVTQARIYDPTTDTVTVLGVSGDFGGGYDGGVLLRDGRVLCNPFPTATLSNTNLRIYNPINNTILTLNIFPSGGNPYHGAVLMNNGKVFFVPRNATQAIIFDPSTNKMNYVGSPSSFPGNNGYVGGVLLPDGKIVCIPLQATQARIYDPYADKIIVGRSIFPGGSNPYVGGALLPNGNIFLFPFNATQGRIYDPVNDSIKTIDVPNSFPGTGGFFGGSLMFNGGAICIPGIATRAKMYGGGGSFDINILLSTYYNKL